MGSRVVAPSYEQSVQFDRGMVELKATCTADEMQRLIENLDIVRGIADGLVDVRVIRDGFTYHVTVTYGLSVAALIEAGHYDWTDSNVTDANFPISGKGTVETDFVLVHLNRVVTDQEVLDELDRRGLRPATNQELLAFGITFPELQRKFPIVQLGSVWASPDGRRDVSSLSESAGGRDVRLRGLDSGWREVCRFLAVRK